MGIFYVTREAVKSALDVNETARSNKRIDQCIDQASRDVEGLLHRRFYPEIRTFKFDYPNYQYAPSWQLWLGENELITKTGLVLQSGAVTIDNANIVLRRADGKNEPPYSFIELSLNSDASFGQGSTWQDDIQGTGLTGYRNDEEPVGTVNEALDSSETAIDISDSAAIGIGDLIRIDNERMIVKNKTLLDTTVNLVDDLTVRANNVTVPVSNGSGFNQDEIILVDAEKMLITDVAGNNLIVKRAWDGTVLAAHSFGADIYAPRTLTVTRGALGTTAATHDTASVINRFLYPPLVVELALAWALTALGQGQSGYNRTIGSGENERESSGRGLRNIIIDAMQAHGRISRLSAI
jgi:hypothetical protein